VPDVSVSSPTDIHLTIEGKSGDSKRTLRFERDEKGDMKSPIEITEEEK
jgi:hypothetical protein